MHSTTVAIDRMARRPSINVLIKGDIHFRLIVNISVAYITNVVPKRGAIRQSRDHDDGFGRRVDADTLEFGRGVVVRGRAVRHAVGKSGGAK